jgi:ribA/ribD-fused uncharacterized protein
MDIIRFYKTVDPFGCFSNFSAHPVFVDGQSWRTSEHYFQAQKFMNPEARHQIRMAETPMRAAQLGRSRDNPLRPDWDHVKDEVMRSVVRLKVTQHADVQETLASTGGAMIVEHTTNDSYWADGGDGTGLNMLGVILMEIRDELAAGKLGEIAACVPPPPWIKYPEIGKGGSGDLGFRMGGGQDYMDEWRDWFTGMSKKNRQRYLTLFDVPSNWSDWLSSQN